MTSVLLALHGQVRDSVERRFRVLLDTRTVLGASLGSLTEHVLAAHAGLVRVRVRGLGLGLGLGLGFGLGLVRVRVRVT